MKLDNYLFNAIPTSDNGYLLAGESHNFTTGANDAMVVKINGSGAVQWSKIYGGASWDRIYALQETSSGDYAFAGYTSSFVGTSGPNAFLMKTNSGGDIYWARTYGGAYPDWIWWMENAHDNGFIMSGSTTSFGPSAYPKPSIFTIKTDSEGYCGCNEASIPMVATNQNIITDNTIAVKTIANTTVAAVASKVFPVNMNTMLQCECDYTARVDGDTAIKYGETTFLTALLEDGIATQFLWSNGSTSATISVSPTVTTTYSVVISKKPCKEIAVITVNVELPCGEIFVPNAFSPNADAQNDILFVKSNCVLSGIFTIYNRWGKKVFETSDLSVGWDGYFYGILNTGVFAYSLSVLLSDGSEVKKNGNVSLVK